MRITLILFIQLLTYVVSNAQSKDDLREFSILVQSYVNKNNINFDKNVQGFARVIDSIQGSDVFMSDQFIRQQILKNPIFKDSIWHHVNFFRDPVADSLIVDVYAGNNIEHKFFGGGGYGLEFNGGIRKFKQSLEKFLVGKIDKGSFVIFLNNGDNIK